MRRIDSGYRSWHPAALALVLIGLSGCAAEDDGVPVPSQTAQVEGLAPIPADGRPTPIPVAYIAPVLSATPSLSPAETQREAARLSEAMAATVPGTVRLSPARQGALVALAQRIASDDHFLIRSAQLVLIVDRAPQGQLLALTLARPGGDWQILGVTRVSTGKPGRLQHFKTPIGVLLNDGSEIGYRALGTFNQNHIRGLGVKGMRVWDFGWHTTDDWRIPGATMAVRVEMHATDPDVLEERIGRADSEGCIRLPDALNRFLDRHGIIDAAIERLGEADGGYRALLSPELDPTPLAGDAVIVVDSSEPWAKPYPPETSVALSD